MVFIFVNEALSVILRSVHSVVNHTPAHLLKEIILVDDNSDSGKNCIFSGEENDVSQFGVGLLGCWMFSLCVLMNFCKPELLALFHAVSLLLQTGHFICHLLVFFVEYK